MNCPAGKNGKMPECVYSSECRLSSELDQPADIVNNGEKAGAWRPNQLSESAAVLVKNACWQDMMECMFCSCSSSRAGALVILSLSVFVCCPHVLWQESDRSSWLQRRRGLAMMTLAMASLIRPGHHPFQQSTVAWHTSSRRQCSSMLLQGRWQLSGSVQHGLHRLARKPGRTTNSKGR